jgi:hypothetical protein
LYPGILSISSLTWGRNQLSVNESISRQEYPADIRSNFGVRLWIFKWRKEAKLCRDRVGKMGGGVVVFVKDHMNCKHRPVALFTKNRN